MLPADVVDPAFLEEVNDCIHDLMHNGASTRANWTSQPGEHYCAKIHAGRFDANTCLVVLVISVVYAGQRFPLWCPMPSSPTSPAFHCVRGGP